MGKKIRADQLIVIQNLASSREQAQRLILAGSVRTSVDAVVRKSSDLIDEEIQLIVEHPSPFVSRGAYKLLPSLDRFLPNLTGRIGIDIGASTGGFTDLMLQRGAEKIYAVDCGHGQLHSKIRNNPKVVVMEKTNARLLTKQQIPDAPSILTMDVSFISATLLLPPLAPLMASDAWAFILVKPQFEAGRSQISRGGVVKEERVHQECIQKVVECAKNLKWETLNIDPSPIKGPKGNQEFVVTFKISS